MSVPPRQLDRSLIRVSGPDALGFLDNLLTQSLEPFHEVGVLYAALLSPQGKVIADMLVWPMGDGVILDTDPTRAPELLRKLTMYKLRANVSIADETSTLMALWSDGEFTGGVRDPRLPALGWRKIAARDSAESGDAAYAAHRLALGVPDLARDCDLEEIFALEGLIEELNGVDFHKGCFVGQENVSRMKRRATTRKKFCPIVFDGEAIAPRTAIYAGEAELGSVRGSEAGRGLALLRLDRALDALHKGQTLSAEGRYVRLDPPAWLTLPQGSAGD